MRQAQAPAEQVSRCPTCNTGWLRDKVITEQFEFEVDGKTKSVVAENVPVSECDNAECRERLSGPEAARIRHEAICRRFGLLTPCEIQAIRERLGPSQERFAQLTGIGIATISRWERGRLLQNRAMDNYLRLVARSEENVKPAENVMLEPVSSWHVSVAAQAFAAAMFARCGLDVSVQYGADQPEYDLVVVKGERLLKVSVKGSQNGAWGLAQSDMKKVSDMTKVKGDYHAALDHWLKRHKPRTILCFVQFKDVPLDAIPRMYLATPAEVSEHQHNVRGGIGGCVLYEAKTWTGRAKSPGITDKIPGTWRFRPERVEELLDRA